jgi:AcrR family transcriptional regulator
MRADARRNRERIVDAARALFAECGPEAQMDDLAARAGVGVGTVYRHFPTKEAVMGELLRQRFAGFAETARAALEDRDGEPFEVFAGVLRRNAEDMADDAATQRAIAMGGVDPASHAAVEFEELMRHASALIDRAHEAGTLRADFNAEDLPTMMCGVCATMAHYASFDWRRHLEMLLDGLRTRPPVAAR